MIIFLWQVVLADILRTDDISDLSDMTEGVLSKTLSDLESKSAHLHYQPQMDKEQVPLKFENDEVILEKIEQFKRRKANQLEDVDLTNSYQDFSYYEENLLKEYNSLPLESLPIAEFKRFSNEQETVVVIGGETEGVSQQAKKFTHSHLGQRVFIPLRRGIDSLNVASATSIILYELQKTFVSNEIK